MFWTPKRGLHRPAESSRHRRPQDTGPMAGPQAAPGETLTARGRDRGPSDPGRSNRSDAEARSRDPGDALADARAILRTTAGTE
jgi:hypothetical protein